MEAHGSDEVPKKSHKTDTNGGNKPSRVVSSHAATVNSPTSGKCSAKKHLLYACPKFKSLPHEMKLSVLKNELCSNCLGSGHFWRQCTSVHKCKVCQKPHHTLLHLDQPSISSTPTTVTTLAQSATSQDGAPVNASSQNVSRNSSSGNVPGILSATAIGIKYNSLLMTCRVRVKSPKGAHAVARALLDSASSASFVSERLAQTLDLPRTKRDIWCRYLQHVTHPGADLGFLEVGF